MMNRTVRRRLLFLGVLLLAVLAGVTTALAAGAGNGMDLPDLDPENLARNVLTFAGPVWFLTHATRRYLWESLDGTDVNWFALALGTVIGIGFYFTAWIDTLLGGLIHGATGGILSFTVVDGVRSTLQTQGRTHYGENGGTAVARGKRG